MQLLERSSQLERPEGLGRRAVAGFSALLLTSGEPLLMPIDEAMGH